MTTRLGHPAVPASSLATPDELLRRPAVLPMNSTPARNLKRSNSKNYGDWKISAMPRSISTDCLSISGLLMAWAMPESCLRISRQEKASSTQSRLWHAREVVSEAADNHSIMGIRKSSNNVPRLSIAKTQANLSGNRTKTHLSRNFIANFSANHWVRNHINFCIPTILIKVLGILLKNSEIAKW